MSDGSADRIDDGQVIAESFGTRAIGRFDIARPAIAGSDSVEWLVDNDRAYRALIAMIRTARRDIWISQLALDADCMAYNATSTPRAGESSNVTIAGELVHAAERGVRVRVLLNASLLLDTVKPLREWLANRLTDDSLFRVRGVSRFPQLLHAKMLIADGSDAMLVGSPFANGYWDDSTHAPLDERRPHRELGGRPVHDVSTRIAGVAVERLASTFAELWNHADDLSAADDERLRTVAVGVARAEDQHDTVRVLRTAPRRSTPRHREGRMEILPAIIDGIARAQSLIYIEHQYLSARPVIDALASALARVPALEIVVVLNQNPDVTAYRGWQNSRLREAGLLEHPRLGLFTLWSARPDAAIGATRVSQIFVHSKVMVIDDRWAMVGSANLDGVSLHSYGDDFVGWPGRRVFRGVRNFDVNVVIDGSSAHDGAGSPFALRHDLWREHLGDAESTRTRPSCAWLARWRSAAESNIRALQVGDAVGNAHGASSVVLPYSMRSRPREQLESLGVTVARGGLELCFEPSWLEVHCSPNWVRNMFT